MRPNWLEKVPTSRPVTLPPILIGGRYIRAGRSLTLSAPDRRVPASGLASERYLQHQSATRHPEAAERSEALEG